MVLEVQPNGTVHLSLGSVAVFLLLGNEEEKGGLTFHPPPQGGGKKESSSPTHPPSSSSSSRLKRLRLASISPDPTTHLPPFLSLCPYQACLPFAFSLNRTLAPSMREWEAVDRDGDMVRPHPPTHPPTHPPIYSSTHPPIHSSTHPPTHPRTLAPSMREWEAVDRDGAMVRTHPPTHPPTLSSIQSSTYSFINPSIYPSIHSSTHPPTQLAGDPRPLPTGGGGESLLLHLHLPHLEAEWTHVERIVLVSLIDAVLNEPLGRWVDPPLLPSPPLLLGGGEGGVLLLEGGGKEEEEEEEEIEEGGGGGSLLPVLVTCSSTHLLLRETQATALDPAVKASPRQMTLILDG